MQHTLDLTQVAKKDIYALGPGFCGESPTGERLSFTNYYMQIDGHPFYGVCGEIHYARLWEARWEEAILKTKMGGINTISTYVFWIHHEEEEGQFDFSGRRDLRRFVALCAKHGLRVIVRVGPFDHGECRNGGLPDWMYGKPYEVRSLDEGFVEATRKWYRRLGQELKGLFYQDGGPIIAAQIDNEYMHSAAPWEQTTGVSNEWIPGGSLGDQYMIRLRDIAREEGIVAPFYTCTGWGGAATPADMMPLWGGYAFRPWIFYSHVGEHPATEEYIYRDNHNNAVPQTYNFEPFYAPESKPYLCCEMGGGMTCCYYYRFQLPYESVDAMANIKLASGCNMLGYYMYHGGTNPRGKRGLYLNESQVPKLSYDYQAALGEFGQIRPSYRRLRALHLFVKAFERSLCDMKTVLPEGSQEIDPTDHTALRYAVRIDEGGSGFLFLNNYQDHAEMRDKQHETIRLMLQNEQIVFDGISLAAGENCVLPFNMDVCGVKLRTATAQPLTTLSVDGQDYAFFFAPEGMTPFYSFAEGAEVVDGSFDAAFTVVQGGKRVRFVTLTRAQSLQLSQVEYEGRTVLVMTDGAAMIGEGCVRFEHDQPELDVSVFPDGVLPLPASARTGSGGLFTRYLLKKEPATLAVTLRQVGATRFVLSTPDWDDAEVKDVRLQIQYQGDIAGAFIDGDMISDHFCNGAPWEIALREFKPRLQNQPLTILITPLKQGSSVNVESAMAGRVEEVNGITGAIQSVSAKAVYEWRMK